MTFYKKYPIITYALTFRECFFMHSVFHWMTKKSYGSNRLSLFLRYKIEKLSINQLIGIYLTGFTFFAGVILPESDSLVSSVKTVTEVPVEQYIPVIEAGQTIGWPLQKFGISQSYSFLHPALDMTAPERTIIHPIQEGTVIVADYNPLGYGNHVIVEHANEITSLYAHLSFIYVKPGDKVNRVSQLGGVGSTGWSTGNHLHLEIRDHGVSLNPQDVLPEIK